MSAVFDQVMMQAGGSRRLMLLLVGGGALAVIWAFARWAGTPSQAALFRGAPLETIAEVTSRLDEAGIAYELANGGSSISVAQPDLARARVLLAGEGLPAAGSPGFELFDQPSWGMTDFTQRVNYRRALEGELERTIGQMKGIETAQVHLALEESSFLRGADNSAEASVVLKLGSGATPAESLVRGVAALVASSVERLEPEAVAVLDHTGNLLSSDGGSTGLADAQLKIRRNMEAYLERKAEDIITHLVGPGNVTVQVSAALNFDQIGRTTQAVDPNQQVITQEDRSEIVPGSADQGAGSLITNSTFETTRSVETVTGGGTRLERLTVAVLVNDKEVVDAAGNTILQARSRQELARIEQLVRNAVGVDDNRGDAISVESLPFVVAPPLPKPEGGFDVVGALQATQRPVIGLAGIVVALVLTLKLAGTIKELTPPPLRPSLGRNPDADAIGPPTPVAMPEPPRFTITDPEMTARVLKSWVKDS